MAEISTNIILDGITLALRSAFPSSHIESDTVRQGWKPPTFLVLLVTAGIEVYPSQRQKRLPCFDVLYFPENGREECYTTADTLSQILRVIDLPSGDLLRGTDLSFQVTDGVLHFLVSYHHFVRKQVEENKMDTLELEQNTVSDSASLTSLP